jgi:hypothetical protein
VARDDCFIAPLPRTAAAASKLHQQLSKSLYKSYREIGSADMWGTHPRFAPCSIGRQKRGCEISSAWGHRESTSVAVGEPQWSHVQGANTIDLIRPGT